MRTLIVLQDGIPVHQHPCENIRTATFAAAIAAAVEAALLTLSDPIDIRILADDKQILASEAFSRQLFEAVTKARMDKLTETRQGVNNVMETFRQLTINQGLPIHHPDVQNLKTGFLELIRLQDRLEWHLGITT